MGSGSQDDVDRARANRDQDFYRIAQYEADLKTARLGSRYDQVASAEANLGALESALAKAEWNLAQKRQAATPSGLVFYTPYRPGEWVAAGKPVVVLLPLGNVKVRAFVPEARMGPSAGDRVRVVVDGVPNRCRHCRFVSPRAGSLRRSSTARAAASSFS